MLKRPLPPSAKRPIKRRCFAMVWTSSFGTDITYQPPKRSWLLRQIAAEINKAGRFEARVARGWFVEDAK